MKKNISDLIDKNRVKMETRIDNYYAEHSEGLTDSLREDLSRHDVMDIVETAKDILWEEYGVYQNTYHRSSLDTGSGISALYKRPLSGPLNLAIRIVGRLEAEERLPMSEDFEEKTEKDTSNGILEMIRKRQNDD